MSKAAQSNVHPIYEIRQATLAEYLTAKRRADELNGEIKKRLGEGWSVEAGMHTAKIQEVESKRPNWKAVVARLKGEGYVRQVLGGTKATIVHRLLVK